MSDDKKVVFPELVKEPETDGCFGCYVWENYQKRFGSCQECKMVFIELLTGSNCKVEKIIFKKPAKWVQCTRENTKVGDEILNLLSEKITIEHFFEFGFSPSQGNCVINDGKYSVVSCLGNYKININR